MGLLQEGGMLERLAAGDVRALARAVSMVEDRAPRAAELVAAGKGLGRRARRIGLTGPPGADKTDKANQGGLGLGGVELDHLGVAVRSIAQAKTFYELLGMQVTHEETVEHEHVKTAMLPMGASRMELLEPTVSDSVIGRFLDKRGEGLHHVAMRVAGIDAKFAAMQAAGIRLASDRVRVGSGGHRYFFVHPASTGGVLVELVGD